MAKEENSSASPLLGKYWENINRDISNATIKPTERAVAQAIILKYEWLGGMGNATSYYGIFFDGWCGGVVCFGFPSASASRKYGHPLDSVVGENYGKHVAQLVRGACVHWAHPHSASKLISGACKLFAKDNPEKKIVLAYADERAGEVGTVYQASNWLYLGQTNPRNRNSAYIIDGTEYDPRTALKKFGTVSKKKMEANGHTFIRVKRTPKHQYVKWIGPKLEGKFWKRQLSTHPYPRRESDQ